ncbi:Protein detoxification 16 [Vitis vinifera]|uniref:Protein detoxification 16 n=1 Tax=Vitis vinifera TaxID=29760 RepID=A0A438H557_VITVI|nr:Protein detoxification 16 [Vitis vinifera]
MAFTILGNNPERSGIEQFGMIILGDGMGSALDTFCGQSFGAKQYHMLGFTTLLHILTCWILVFKSGLRNKGAALQMPYLVDECLVVSDLCQDLPFLQENLDGFFKEAMHDVPKFLRLAIPSAVMICLEIWSFEMMVLLSGLLPNPKLETSALSISLNICSVIYMIPLGLSGAISVRVSNELGAGRPQSARLAIYVVLFMVTIEGVLVATILISGHKFWGYSYSNEEKVVKYVGEIIGVGCSIPLLGWYSSVLSGMVRGSGKQKIGALINLGAYYLVGIPFGALLAFVYHIGGKAKKATDRVHHDSMVPVNVA